MKLFIAFALFALVAAKPSLRYDQEEIDQIVAAINSPSTDPATAAALDLMLQQILGNFKPEPIQVGPAIIDEYHPIHVGPAIVDEYHPIHVGPAIIDEYHPIQFEPAFVEDYHPVVIDDAPAQAPASSPLVQIIVNVKSESTVGSSPVAVEGIEKPDLGPAPTPVIVVENAQEDYEPVLVAELPQLIVPEPVQVVESSPVIPEPVVVAPVVVAPVVNVPDTLN